VSFTVVIPVRFGSVRLPGKPLLDIAGKPMVQRVYECARGSSARRVVIATDDERILDAAGSFGAEAVMTGAGHLSGTERIEEACRMLGLPAESTVVNVQGDEPLIPPAVIDRVAADLAANPRAEVATLCEPLGRADEMFNPDIVKVVMDAGGMALYFSRAPIPWSRGDFAAGRPAADVPAGAFRHLGIYAYRVSFLRDFVAWPPAELEATEGLEQLRAMANGARIHVGTVRETVPPGVDTAEDLELVRRIVEERG